MICTLSARLVHGVTFDLAGAETRSEHVMQVGEEVLGQAAKVEVSKENTTIVGDGSSEVCSSCSCSLHLCDLKVNNQMIEHSSASS